MLHNESYVKLWQPIKNDPYKAFSFLLQKFQIQLMKKCIILENKMVQKLKLPKNVNNKRCVPKIKLFIEKKIERFG